MVVLTTPLKTGNKYEVLAIDEKEKEEEISGAIEFTSTPMTPRRSQIPVKRKHHKHLSDTSSSEEATIPPPQPQIRGGRNKINGKKGRRVEEKFLSEESELEISPLDMDVETSSPQDETPPGKSILPVE
ncbi:hypothetical protein ACJMK2_040423 [Sinanodonta woodiana]|uniref:Uncharacterized protein n=1 Tax=Sinanodonta woodiana TaxID=1069815 RepID=A0ABD3WIE3_SINWO